MPTAVGPNTKGEDNLVFGYDLGDSRNSYKGEPTENLITDTATFDSSFWNQKSGTITANDAIGPRGIQNAAKIVATNTDPYIYSSAIVTASTGNNTWSIWVKGIGNTVGKSAQVRINFSGTATGTADTNASVNLTERWQLLQTTANVTSGGTIKFGLEAPNGAVSGDIMYFADPMFEQKSHATQFVNGTRSVSGSLIDLTGNSTIDLSNVSFDSNAQITFDGTSDYATIDHNTVMRDTGSLVVEAVFQVYSQFGYYGGIIGKGTSDANEEYFLGIYPSGNKIYFDVGQGSGPYVNASQTINSNQYYHVVAMHERAGGTSTCSIYVNGEFVSNTTSGATNSVNTNTTDITIGSRWSDGSYSLNGDIPFLKMYNRILTASEIKANYNAIKGRFNI